MNIWLFIVTLISGLPCYGTEAIWISIDPQEMTVNVDQFGSFYINLNSPVNESLELQLLGNNDGIAAFNESVNFPANDSHQEICVKGLHPGHVDVWVNDTCQCSDSYDVTQAHVRIAVRKSEELDIFSNVVGWGYFLAWGIAFYPQIVTNFLRKSVVGLHFDFIAYNIIGFACYAIFNCGVYFSETVQDQYYIDHPHGIIPVRLNDVLFSLYAVAGTMIVIIQAFIYERGDQRMSKIGIGTNCVFFLFLFISLILSLTDVINWLMYLYFFSYVKLILTIIKYMPQAYYNYERKSTDGWNIWNVLLDFTGGILSILQMFLLSANYDDWGSIFGDPTKFGLGLFTVLFDVLFIIQHYILYRPSKQPKTISNGDIVLETANSTSNMGFTNNEDVDHVSKNDSIN